MIPDQNVCWRCGEITTFHIYYINGKEYRTCEDCEEELNK